MKYLFFDCEFANCFENKEKICEFGYAMVNENFEILYKDNIIINPNIKRNEWDWYALKNILTRKREVYENRLFFPAYFKKISTLIHSADYIFGHSISTDVHAINSELQRYNLPALNFEFYDIKEIFKEYANVNKNISVEGILSQLGIKGDENKHDAEVDAFNTMLELKTILGNLEFSLEELISCCPKAKNKTFDFIIEFKKQYGQHEITRKEELQKKNFLKNNTMRSSNGISNRYYFLGFLKNVKVTKEGKGKLQGQKVSFSLNYEKTHFREIMNLVQIIKNEGGEYILRASDADIFVTYASYNKEGNLRTCNREKYVDEAIKKGKTIEKFSLNQFLKILEVTEVELRQRQLSFDFSNEK